MSLVQTYSSVPMVYEPQDLTVTQTRNAYLRVPPRVYDEALTAASPVRGVFAYKRPTVTSQVTLAVLCIFDYVAGSGTRVTMQEFDAVTGAFIRTTNLGTSGVGGGGLGVNTTDIKPGRLDELWYAYQSTEIREFVATTWTYTGESFLYNSFTPVAVHPWAIDTVANRLLVKNVTQGVNIFNLKTGALLSVVEVGGNVLDVFLEDVSRAYVITDEGLLVLIDYVNLLVLGVARIDFQSGTLSFKRFGWDKFYRRILTVEPSADNADGSATTIIRGYHPTPLGVGVMKPIPLRTPRNGRSVPILTRVFGNAGEPIGGASVRRTIAGDASIAAASRVTDESGYAIFDATCDAVGSTTIDFEVTQ